MKSKSRACLGHIRALHAVCAAAKIEDAWYTKDSIDRLPTTPCFTSREASQEVHLLS